MAHAPVTNVITLNRKGRLMGGPLNLSLRDWFKPQRPEDRGLADFVFTRQLRHRLAGSVSVGDLALLAGIQRARSAELLALVRAFWISDIEPRFTCQACGQRGADVRPNRGWVEKTCAPSTNQWFHNLPGERLHHGEKRDRPERHAPVASDAAAKAIGKLAA